MLVLGQGARKGFDWAIYSPLEAAMFLAAALVLIPLGRACVRTWVLPSVLRPRRALIVGAGLEGRVVQRKLEAHPEFGLQVIGFVDAERGPEVLGDPSDLPRLIDTLEVDWVVMATSAEPTGEMLDLMRAVRRPDVHLSIVPSYSELFASNATIEELEGIPVVSLPPMRLSRSIRTVKRAIDLVASRPRPARAVAAAGGDRDRDPARHARARSSSASAGTAAAAASSRSSSSARWSPTPRPSAWRWRT